MREYRYDEMKIGLTEHFKVRIVPEMLDHFKNITGDTNSLHCDDEFAQQGGYRGKVVYGFLVSSFYSTLAGVYLPGKWSLIYDVNIGMTSPVYVGDELTVFGQVTDKNDTYKIVTLKIFIKSEFAQWT